MVYIDGAYDSKVWVALNHFETTQQGAMLKSITKKRYPCSAYPFEFLTDTWRNVNGKEIKIYILY